VSVRPIRVGIRREEIIWLDSEFKENQVADEVKCSAFDLEFWHIYHHFISCIYSMLEVNTLGGRKCDGFHRSITVNQGWLIINHGISAEDTSLDAASNHCSISQEFSESLRRGISENCQSRSHATIRNGNVPSSHIFLIRSVYVLPNTFLSLSAGEKDRSAA
jgi:hypothetical protein